VTQRWLRLNPCLVGFIGFCLIYTSHPRQYEHRVPTYTHTFLVVAPLYSSFVPPELLSAPTVPSLLESSNRDVRIPAILHLLVITILTTSTLHYSVGFSSLLRVSGSFDPHFVHRSSRTFIQCSVASPQTEPREVLVVVGRSLSLRPPSLLAFVSVPESRPSGPCLLVEITTAPSQFNMVQEQS